MAMARRSTRTAHRDSVPGERSAGSTPADTATPASTPASTPAAATPASTPAAATPAATPAAAAADPADEWTMRPDLVRDPWLRVPSLSGKPVRRQRETEERGRGASRAPASSLPGAQWLTDKLLLNRHAAARLLPHQGRQRILFMVFGGSSMGDFLFHWVAHVRRLGLDSHVLGARRARPLGGAPPAPFSILGA